ncbi:UDP-galactopyranose mutase [Pseudomonas nitroreducens]|uniref:UDP-galactopyranose mutase n=1 Tax=Pseudomonas nitroreducens TaxID=46680 RepID=UPI002659E959|nr:UDP-galactopyranose mutase [Pseudomonas nitroreducens]MCP1647229.1 UDP-galactopyranose mutase [Pseudomonas nitroreducens]MCP1685805.1 UDP-galactopyranose mutase [Pseudomonas nitroreducens]
MILIVGAGFSGAVIAYKLANAGFQVKVVDKRNHLAGNCHTERDAESGVMLHKYGPHIFHTDNKEVWDFLCNFTNFMNYTNRVKATISEGVFSLPINLHTINQLFGKALSPQEAQDFIANQSDASIDTPISFEDQGLKFVGEKLYNSFLKGYTKKQWGISPQELPASILKRLPVRFNYDDNYFNHKYQGMPADGYTEIVRKMLTHPNISIELGKLIDRSAAKKYQHVFYSGPLDEWFNYSEGRLAYRTLDFEEIRGDGDIQGCAVMNYCDEQIPYTRISEHKYFSPWESHEKSIAYREYSRECGSNDIPYYPIRLVNEQNQLKRYIELAQQEKGVSFIGRLGTYRYLDMDTTIAEALHSAQHFILARKENKEPPAFYIDPLK